MERNQRLKPLSTADDLEVAFATSRSRLVLIFKHSSTCGRSAMAAEEVVDWLDATDHHADVYVLDVRRNRALSQLVAERLKVRHESPQVLLVRDAKARWHTSHAGVTARAIERAIRAATEGPLSAAGRGGHPGHRLENHEPGER